MYLCMFVPSYLSICLPTYLPTYHGLNVCVPITFIFWNPNNQFYLPIYVHSFISICLAVYLSTYLPTYWPTYLSWPKSLCPHHIHI